MFDQPNLPTLLREIEQCVENNNSPTHKYTANWPNSLPLLSPTSNWSTNSNSPNVSFSTPNAKSFLSGNIIHAKWSAIVRQKIFELEGPNFRFKPLFSDPPAPEVIMTWTKRNRC